MHRSRIVALSGVVLTAGALLLPFVTLTGAGGMDGIGADAWPVVFPAGAVGLLLLVGDRGESPPTWLAAATSLLALGALGFAVAKLLDARNAVADAGGSIQSGAWVLPAAALVLVAGALAGFSRRL